MERVEASTCENPKFPNWMWRYNRNKRLARFEPWFTRSERWPPQYRNMGLHDDFRFHPVGPNEESRPFVYLAANYAHDLVNERETGYGNGALGFTPGPAPPRLVLYDVQNPYPRDELYKVNEIHDISPGMSLLDNTNLPKPESDHTTTPLNPRQYLERTLGQSMEYPGTFPHFNAPSMAMSGRMCNTKKCGYLDPLEHWTVGYKKREIAIAIQNAIETKTRLPPIVLNACEFENNPAPACESMKPTYNITGARQCVMAARKIY